MELESFQIRSCNNSPCEFGIGRTNSTIHGQSYSRLALIVRSAKPFRRPGKWSTYCTSGQLARLASFEVGVRGLHDRLSYPSSKPVNLLLQECYSGRRGEADPKSGAAWISVCVDHVRLPEGTQNYKNKQRRSSTHSECG